MSRRMRVPTMVTVCLVAVLAACAPMPPGAGLGNVATQEPAKGAAQQTLAGDLALGQQALASGDAVLAKRAYSAALRKDPDNPEVVLGMAEAHLALGEIDAARQLFDVLANKAPALMARVRQGQGLVALRTGRDDQAIQLLGDSVRRDQSLWRAWLGLGQAHDRQGQAEAARRAFIAAERMAPRQAAVQNDIGMTYLSEKEPRKALGFFKTALSIDPSFEVARANVRIAHAMIGDYENAIAGAPDNEVADVLNNVGYVAILNKDFEVADRLLRRALEVSPTYHRAAVANLDLLQRMASDRAPGQGASQPRKTAAAPDARSTEAVAALTTQPGPVEVAEAAPDDRADTSVSQQPGSTDPASAPRKTPAPAKVAEADRSFRWDTTRAVGGASATGPISVAALDPPKERQADTRAPSRANKPNDAQTSFKWSKPPRAEESDRSVKPKSDARPDQRLSRVKVGDTTGDRLVARAASQNVEPTRKFIWSDRGSTNHSPDVPARTASVSDGGKGDKLRQAPQHSAHEQQSRMEDDGFLWID